MIAEFPEVLISEKLRECIEKSELSYNQIAQNAGVPTPSITRFVAGERGLSMDVIDRLAKYFQLELTDKPKKRGGK